jgi:hypothetical protein
MKRQILEYVMVVWVNCLSTAGTFCKKGIYHYYLPYPIQARHKERTETWQNLLAQERINDIQERINKEQNEQMT